MRVSRIVPRLLVLLAPLALMAPAARGQADPCLDHIGVYFDEAATAHCRSTTTASELVTAYLVLTRPSVLGSIGGWECSVQLEGDPLALTWTLAGDALNVDQPPQFQVGLPAGLPFGTAVVLASASFLVASPSDSIRIFVRPYHNPSLPAWAGPVYAEAQNPGVLVPLTPSTGDADTPAATVNAACPDIVCTANSLFVDMVAEGAGVFSARSRAASRELATDSFDEGLDVPWPISPTPALQLYFPHPDWPMGDRYKTDVRALFDWTSVLKAWSFAVTTSLSGPVTLRFSPSFTASPFGSLQLRDNATGQVRDLFPDLQYTYAQEGGTRSFDLLIGPRALTGFSVAFDVEAGSHRDRANRAAAQSGATDGFDAVLDVPEPGPPPSGYVAAWFPHAGWPLGYRYRTDVRALYDPRTAQMTWTFVVQTDQIGTVRMTFLPDFSMTDEILLQLTDPASGTTVDLFPALSYEYAQPAPGSRTFELTIGSQTTPGSSNPPVTAVDEPSALARRLIAYPNPFNPATTLSFELSAPTEARLSIYDLAGREIRTLLDGPLPAGPHETRWNGRNAHGRRAPSGVYVARLVTLDGHGLHARLVLLQ
jgi:hypothetical protein